MCDTLLDYSLHVLDMSESDAMQLLTHEGFLSDGEARERWRVVQLTSVQLEGIFAGYSAIYNLREELRHERGSRFDLARFDVQFQSYGCAPVKVIREPHASGADGSAQVAL